MADPPGEEQGEARPVQVGRLDVGIGEELAGVVQDHQDHDHAPQQIHRLQPAGVPGQAGSR